MEECVFCKIVEGKIPAHKVYEDKDFLAFLDMRPLNPGHTLVIPKKHYRYVDQVPNFGQYFEFAKKVGKGIKKVTGYEHLYYLTLGNLVKHAHIWVFPHFDGDGHGTSVDWNSVKKLGDEELKEIAKKITESIKG